MVLALAVALHETDKHTGLVEEADTRSGLAESAVKIEVQ